MRSKADIVKAIRLVVESYDSHLDFAVDAAKNCEHCGDEKFHKKTSKEYLFVLAVLTDLL